MAIGNEPMALQRSMGAAHVKTVLKGMECNYCGDMSLSSLCSRLAFPSSTSFAILPRGPNLHVHHTRPTYVPLLPSALNSVNGTEE